MLYIFPFAHVITFWEFRETTDWRYIGCFIVSSGVLLITTYPVFPWDHQSKMKRYFNTLRIFAEINHCHCQLQLIGIPSESPETGITLSSRSMTFIHINHGHNLITFYNRCRCGHVQNIRVCRELLRGHRYRTFPWWSRGNHKSSLVKSLGKVPYICVFIINAHGWLCIALGMISVRSLLFAHLWSKFGSYLP